MQFRVAPNKTVLIRKIRAEKLYSLPSLSVLHTKLVYGILSQNIIKTSFALPISHRRLYFTQLDAIFITMDEFHHIDGTTPCS